MDCLFHDCDGLTAVL